MSFSMITLSQKNMNSSKIHEKCAKDFMQTVQSIPKKYRLINKCHFNMQLIKLSQKSVLTLHVLNVTLIHI